MMGLPDGEKNVKDICNCFDRIPACDRQTDRQRDGQTSCHVILLTMHTRRAVKIIIDLLELQDSYNKLRNSTKTKF